MIAADGAGSSTLQVRGGVGGIAVRVGDLLSAAGRLEALARLLWEHATQACALMGRMNADGCVMLDPVGHRAAADAVEAVIGGPAGLGPLSVAMHDTADRLKKAADAYQHADSSASEHWAVIREYALGSLLPMLTVPAAADGLASVAGLDLPGLSQAGDLADGAIIEILVQNPELTEGLTGLVPELTGRVTLSPGLDTGYELAQRLQTWAGVAGTVAAGHPWFADGGRATVSVPGAGSRVPPPAGIVGVVCRIPRASEADPQIRIERIDSRSGPHWIVTVPGTAGLPATGGTSPFDGAGALGVAAQQRTAGVDAVERAMRAVHIPKDQPVLLAGHSQGGMIAAAVAAEPSIARRFSISHVLTAGSPIGETRIPGTVRVLSIEHTDDLVPKLDSARNPDRANWTTVSTPVLKEGDDPFRAHDRNRYARTAALLDASNDPSIDEWRSSAQGFIGSSDGPATGWTIHVQRSPASAPPLAAGLRGP